GPRCRVLAPGGTRWRRRGCAGRSVSASLLTGGVRGGRQRGCAVRRGSIAAVLVGAVALLAAGCGRPPGVDGDLTNNWPAMPEAKIAVRADHACYRTYSATQDAFARIRDPVECSGPHEVETVHVGIFTGEDAGRDTPPPAGGPGRRTAY